MAIRKTTQRVTPEMVLKALEEFESTKENPTTSEEIAGEFDGMTVQDAHKILTALEESGKITGSNDLGFSVKWWLVDGTEEVPAETPKPKRKRRTKAEMEAAREEERKRLEYAVRAAETQDMDMSQSPIVQERDNALPYSSEALADLDIMAKGEPPATAAVEPVQDSAGENITIPVDYDDPSKGRRELDASQGEKVLGESTYTRRKPSEAEMTDLLAMVRERLSMEKTLTEEQMRSVVEQVVTNTPFGVTLHEPKNDPALSVEIPPLPAGVHPNTWELAHEANTESARAYWMRKAEEQRKAHVEHMEALEESRKAVSDDGPPF